MEIEELKKDLAEIKQISEQATRKHVRELLLAAKQKIETTIRNKEELLKFENAAANGSAPVVSKPASNAPVSDKSYVVDLNEYAWDQSDKFVKIFVTLDGVQKLTEDNVQTVFTSSSMVLIARNLNGKDFRLTINNLLRPINVDKSYYKIKSDMVAIYMKKDAEETWSHLTLTEKRLDDIKSARLKPEVDEDSKDDPMGGIMGMMKKMYENGDPEMKRMMMKAWSENQGKMGGEI